MNVFLENDHDHEIGVVTKSKARVPKLYVIILLNDDFTPRAFVVEVLLNNFKVTITQAEKIMMTAHKQGTAACGTYPKDVAEAKLDKVLRYISESKYPLNFTMEPA